MMQPPKPRPIHVAEIIEESPEAKTFILDVPPYTWQYSGGQFITLEVVSQGESLRRSYSLATCPYTDPRPGITVKRLAHGRVSSLLHEQLCVGDALQVIGPQGSFTLPSPAHELQELVFIGAGSGITPLFSLIKSALYRAPQARIALLYGSRDQAHIIYQDGLARLQEDHPHRLAITHVLSRPAADWTGQVGRIGPALLVPFLKAHSGAHFFLCGPGELMRCASELLMDIGLPRARLHQESFHLPEAQEAPLTHQATSLTLYYEGDRYQTVMRPGQSLLEAATQEGIDIPYACTTGMCNSCVAKCTSGQVRMLQEEGLTQEELEEGYVLTCVGYPASDHVSLEVGT